VAASGKTVISASIDALSLKHGRPDVVMLDVEGYECRALSGATETLRSGPDWFVEVHGGCGLESFGGSIQKVVRRFQDFEYTLYCQTDEHYREQVCPMSAISEGRFFLIATRNAEI